MYCIAVRRTDPLYAPANPRLDVMTMSPILFVRFSSVTLRSSGCSTLPALLASSRTISRTFIVYALVPTARFSDFWNFAVAIICIVLVIFLMFRTALRRFTIARALAMGFPCPSRWFGVTCSAAEEDIAGPLRRQPPRGAAIGRNGFVSHAAMRRRWH